MYEADKESEYGLEAETLRRMREVFGGRTCSACGAPAARVHGEEFFCHEHYPRARKPVRSPRVYRCQLPAATA